MKLAILDTPAGRYFYYHFLPLVKENIEDVVLAPRELLEILKERGYLIASDDEGVADIYLLKFLSVNVSYSFTAEDVERFRSVISGAR